MPSIAGGYSNADLDRIISNMFELREGGSACKIVLPEDQVPPYLSACEMVLQTVSGGAVPCETSLDRSRRGGGPQRVLP